MTESSTAGTVGILWRGDSTERSRATSSNNRLHRVFKALADVGIRAEPVVYSDESIDEVRKQALQLDGVLVWVNPISDDDQDRSCLDPLLRDLSSRGVWVSAHPDVILKMGTKQVLHDTRHLGWGTDTHVYRNLRELQDELPPRLANGPRVLKQHRGNGGSGVWKVEWLPRDAEERLPASDDIVHVLHAERGSEPEELRLGDFLRRCGEYFLGTGRIVEQPFQPRLPDGMVRCYLAQGKVVGFAHQLIRALMPPPPAGSPPEAAQPGPRIMYPADAAGFERLRYQMEAEWVPELQELLQIERSSLPVVWDADFLYGPRTPSGDDTYVLCEINVSCVFPFPDQALPELARCTLRCLHSARSARQRS